jgi:hypothetical protein
LAHAMLIGVKGALRARRSHSFELDRHSVAESMGHTPWLRAWATPSALLGAKSTALFNI